MACLLYELSAYLSANLASSSAIFCSNSVSFWRVRNST
ncbi:Uncharacterised protein [Vibrio cholerae]|nr:Uncharacterised protein [Vibrio cholerae]